MAVGWITMSQWSQRERRRLRRRLAATESSLSQLRTLVSFKAEANATFEEWEGAFNKLKTMLAHDSITIAFLGPFTSGKSTLISSIVGRTRLEFEEVADKGTEQSTRTVARLKSLLPSTPRRSTACPVVIDAIDAASDEAAGDRLAIKFDDDPTRWVDMEATTENLRAYTTSLPEMMRLRREGDEHRHVTLARLEIPSEEFSARLCDLPGFGSDDRSHDQISLLYLAEADCVVFVADANKPLSYDQMDDLRAIYHDARPRRKPVIFVLSKFDKETDYDDVSGRMNWEVVQDENELLIREAFEEEVGEFESSNDGWDFLGPGFLAVSAQLEARSRTSTAQSEAVALLEQSGIPRLRARLSDILEEESGPRRLGQIEKEIDDLADSIAQLITDVVAVLETPLEEIQSSVRAIDVSVEAIRIEEKRLLGDGRRLVEETVSAAFRDSDIPSLAQVLDQSFDHYAKTNNLSKSRGIHNLQLGLQRTAVTWVEKSNGVAQRWDRATDRYFVEREALVSGIRERFTAATATELASSGKTVLVDVSLIPIELKGSLGVTSNLRDSTAIDSTMKLWPVASTVGTAGTVAAGLSLLALPLAGLAVIGIGFGFGRRRRAHRAAEAELRGKTSEIAEATVTRLRVNATMTLEESVHAIERYLAQRRARLLAEREQLQARRGSKSIHSVIEQCAELADLRMRLLDELDTTRPTK